MRKFITLLAIAFALVSCNTEKVADYTYEIRFDASDSVLPENFEAMVSYVKTFDYFKEPQTYHGTYSDTYHVAADQFQLSVALLDEQSITSHLEKGQIFGIFLLLRDNQSPVMAIYFTPDNASDSENE